MLITPVWFMSLCLTLYVLLRVLENVNDDSFLCWHSQKYLSNGI